MANDEIRKHGAVTDYRPDDERLRGGKDHSVQTEALGEEGSANLAQSGTTTSGAAGRVDDQDETLRRPFNGRDAKS